MGLFVSMIVTTGWISIKFGGRMGNGTGKKSLNFGAHPDKEADPGILISIDNLALAEICALLLFLSPQESQKTKID